MQKKLIKNNPPTIIFFTTLKKNFGTAHYLRVKHYQSFFSKKFIFAFDDESDSEIKEIVCLESEDKEKDKKIKDTLQVKNKIDLKEFITYLKKLNTDQLSIGLLVFDLRELEGQFFVDLFEAFPKTAKVILDSQENFLTSKVTYTINPLPLVDYFPTNLYGLDYLYLSKFPSLTKEKVKGKTKKNVVFYVGLIDNPHYLRSAFKKIKTFYTASPELKNTSLIVIIDNIEIPFLKVFVKTYLGGIEVLFQQRLSSFSSLAKLKPILFITHYGVSLVEALKNHLPTLIFDPSKYHAALSQKHFPGLVYREGINLKQIMANSKDFFQANPMGNKAGLVVEVLEKLSNFTEKPECPNCASKRLTVSMRKNWFNLVECAKCNLIFHQDLGLKKVLAVPTEGYKKDYFFEKYQKQYGKSYIDDKKNINRLNQRRIEILSKYQTGPSSDKKVLDIGAALGFFLDLMQEKGYTTYASEISAYAKGYLKKNTSHVVLDGALEKGWLNAQSSKARALEKEKFDVITLWYVIEHFPDLEELFRQISSNQPSGGILAFSTPNGAGLSALKDRRNFLSRSPDDHYFIFSKKNIVMLLKKNGYKPVKFYSTGIHYSRFKELYPWLKFFVPQVVYELVAKVFNRGDTFEVYAVKEKSK